MSVIIAKDLFKTYKQGDAAVDAVRDINLTVEAGELISVMGQSGSGKTTLLNLLGCMERPSGGTIHIGKTEVSTARDKVLAEIRRKKIGVIFQDFKLVPIMTAEENIHLPVLLDKRKVEFGRYDELVRFLKIADRMKHLPSELSGGQRQRVAIARALINNPAILLADEPTGNLDKAAGDEIINLLLRINKERGTTILLVTHEQAYADQCTRKFQITDGVLTER